MIHHTLLCNGCADTFFDDPHDLENPVSPSGEGGYTITDAHGRGWLRGCTVDPNVPARAGIGGRRARRIQAHCPQPLVDTRVLHSKTIAHRVTPGLVGGQQIRPTMAA